MTLAALLAPYAARAEEAMRRVVPPLDEQPAFFGQLHYHLGWANAAFQPEPHPGGKRVRAALCLMAAEAFTGETHCALPAAAAVELLHEFSLIHDDIEDGDPLRRHRPTLWQVVGVPQAINAGDGLFALAQQALLGCAAAGVPAPTVIRALTRFNETVVTLCLGQFLDMSFEARAAITPAEYLAMIQGKTAVLLAFAGEVGALVSGAPDADVAALHELGEALGLAFQMRDDLLGLWGDPARTGKPVGADVQARKKSLPVAYALSQPGSERLRALYAAPIETLAAVAEATRLIEETGAREAVAALAAAQEHRALAALERLSPPPERLTPLWQLVEGLAARQH